MCSRSRDFRENHWRVKIYCIVMGVLQKRKNEGVILSVVLNRDLRCFAIVHFRRGENLAINGRCVFILYTAKRETSAVVFCCMIWLDSLWVYVTSKFFTSETDLGIFSIEWRNQKRVTRETSGDLGKQRVFVLNCSQGAACSTLIWCLCFAWLPKV